MDLGNYSEWPKVAGAVIKANFSIDSGRQAGKGVPLQESWPGKVC